MGRLGKNIRPSYVQPAAKVGKTLLTAADGPVTPCDDSMTIAVRSSPGPHVHRQSSRYKAKPDIPHPSHPLKHDN